MAGLESQLLQKVVGQQSSLHRSSAAQGHALALQILDCRNVRGSMRDEMRCEVHVHIPHRHDLTRVLETAFDLDIGQGSIPGQVDLAFDKSLDEGVIVSVKHPVEIDTVPAK